MFHFNNHTKDEVDTNDQMCANNNGRRTKRQPMVTSFHQFNLCDINSYVMYKAKYIQKNISKAAGC